MQFESRFIKRSMKMLAAIIQHEKLIYLARRFSRGRQLKVPNPAFHSLSMCWVWEREDERSSVRLTSRALRSEDLPPTDGREISLALLFYTTLAGLRSIYGIIKLYPIYNFCGINTQISLVRSSYLEAGVRFWMPVIKVFSTMR